MALEHKDRVRDATTSTGTGSFTLALSSPAGFRNFTAFTNGSQVRYSVANASQSEWEVGLGTWTSSTATLSRDTVYASSNNGEKVSFSAGTKAVTCGPVAQDIQEAATKAGSESLSNKTLVNPAGQDQTLSDGATVNWNVELGQTAYLTLGAQSSRTIANPTNLKKGVPYTLIVDQDATGGRTIAGWGSVFKLLGDVTLTATAGARHIFYFFYDGTYLSGGLVFKTAGAAPAPAPTQSTSFSPSTVFTGAVQGAWFDPDVTTMETTATSSVKLTAPDQRIGKWLDKSGNNNHVIQSDDLVRPYYRLTTTQPHIAYEDQRGLRNTTGGGGATSNMYGCIGVEITTTVSAIWSDSSAANTGIRIIYNQTDGGITLVAGNGTGTVSLFQPLNAPMGKHIVQWWYDGSAQTINMKVSDASTLSTTLATLAAGGPGFALGSYYDGVSAVNGAKVYFHAHTKNYLPSATVRGQFYDYAKIKLLGSATAPAPAPAPAPAVSGDTLLADGFPSKLLGTYFESYRASSSFKITDVSTNFNLIYLFHCKFNADGSARFDHYAEVPFADIQTCRSRGQRVILTVGGAGNQMNWDTTAKVNAFVASFKDIAARLGGVDGIDFNNYEGITVNTANMISIAQQLKDYYEVTAPPVAGFKFAITTPAAPNSPADQTLAKAMSDAGVLNWVAPQYYDVFVGWKHQGFISGLPAVAGQEHSGVNRNKTWVDLLGASKVCLGLSANYWGVGETTPYRGALTLSECQREWNECKRVYPSQRGVYAWNAQLEGSSLNQNGGASSDGNHVWSNAMKPLVRGT